MDALKERLHSSSWYRVYQLTPRLRSHAEIHRNHYRGKLWYVVRDSSSERFFRVSPESYRVVALFDGKRSVQEIWEAVSQELGDAAPTQDQMIQLLGQLHAADLLQANVSPDAEEALRRHVKLRRTRWLQQMMSPLFWRFPLFDPETFLSRALPWLRPAFSWLGFLVWLGVVVAGVSLAVMHWQDLSENVIDRVLAPKNLLLLWLLFPILKGLHEFGHAFAVKIFGGEVHEMGIMLLVLSPFPYVDASAASAFGKRERILVSSAGMMVEVFLASLALFLWLGVEPGTVRVVLYNILFLAGVSTILFNINPLLRFDGYYILSDLIEIPNLRSRSTRHLTHLIEKHLFGCTDQKVPPSTSGERRWFVFYAIAAFFYRILIFVGILLFIATKFFFVGVALAIWGLISWGVVPLVGIVKYLSTSPRLRRVRGRAVAASIAVVLLFVSLICVVPAPLNTAVEGVVWIPEDAVVRAGADGFITKLAAEPGSSVRRGDVLFVMEDRVTEARVRLLEAEVREIQARLDQAFLRDRVKTELIREQLNHRNKELARERERLDELTLRSAVDGNLVVFQPEDLPGRFLRKGTPLAQVVDRKTITARVVVTQDEIDLVRGSTKRLELRLAENPGRVFKAQILREVPGASARLPSAALALAGGGRVVTDPFDPEGVKAVESLFQLDLKLLDSPANVNLGGRVYVRFGHGWEPLAGRFYRSVRRLFLSRFNV